MVLQIWLLSPQKLCSLDCLVLCFQSLLSMGKPVKPQVTRDALFCLSLHDAEHHSAKDWNKDVLLLSLLCLEDEPSTYGGGGGKQAIKYKHYWRRTRERWKIVVSFDQMITLICSVKVHFFFCSSCMFTLVNLSQSARFKKSRHALSSWRTCGPQEHEIMIS